MVIVFIIYNDNKFCNDIHNHKIDPLKPRYQDNSRGILKNFGWPHIEFYCILNEKNFENLPKKLIQRIRCRFQAPRFEIEAPTPKEIFCKSNSSQGNTRNWKGTDHMKETPEWYGQIRSWKWVQRFTYYR